MKKSGLLLLLIGQWGYFVVVFYFIFQTVIFFNKSGFITGDLGREIYIPIRVLEGQILYKDFSWLYGPLPLYINAALFRLFSISIQPLYYASLLVGLATAILAYRLSKFFLPTTISVLITLLFIKVSMFGFTWQSFILSGKSATIWATLFSFLILNHIISKVDDSSKPNSLIIGILTGLIAITKVDYFFAISLTSAFFYILILSKKPKEFFKTILIYSIGVLSAIILTLAMLIIAGKIPFSSIIENIFPFYASSYWFTNRRFYDFTSFIITFKTEFLVFLPILIIALKNHIGKFNLNLVKIISFVFLLLIFWKFNFNVIAFTFFQPLLVLSGIVFLPVFFFNKVELSQKKGLMLILVFFLLLTLRDKFSVSGCNMIFPSTILVGSLYSLTKNNLIFNKKVLTFLLFIILTLLLIKESNYLFSQQYSDKTIYITSGRGLMTVEPAPSGLLFEVVSELNRTSLPQDALTAFPLEASINYFSGMKNPLKEDQFVNGLIPPGNQFNIINELKLQRPLFITISNYEFLGYFGLNYNQQIYKWVLSNYKLVKVFGCLAPYDTTVKCSGYGIRLFKLND